ncbi:hypothetical protein ACFLRW_01600 [Acidobacteriota bacterium]
MRNSRFFGFCLGLVLLCGTVPLFSGVGEPDIQGAWKIEGYELKAGGVPRVRGTIFFGEHDWAVLFFVVDAEGQPLRASGEGGTYVVEGDRLMFTHMYLMASGGDPVDGLQKNPPQMKLDSNIKEDCRIELTGNKLTIFFPSGNRMRFVRSSPRE